MTASENSQTDRSAIVGVIGFHEVAKAFGLTPRGLRRWVADGVIPPPIKVTGKILCWRRETLDQWIDRIEKEQGHGEQSCERAIEECVAGDGQ